jgi:signal transduction histidine kinase
VSDPATQAPSTDGVLTAPYAPGLAGLLAMVSGIVALDFAVPPGVVVGILLSLPILLSATLPTRRDVLIVTGAALVGKGLEAVFGGTPVTPPIFWVPNRILTFLLIPASASLALVLQRHARATEAARDSAVAARELNRLLMSLLAHDLRAPLVVARQCIGYVGDALGRGMAPDPGLLSDTAGRLDRSLRAIEIVLAVARRDPQDGATVQDGAGIRIAEVVAAEVDSFRAEALQQGKRMEVRLDGAGDAEAGANLLVLRQSLAILLDNAIRYALPGEVLVTVEREAGATKLSVRDAGPDATGPAQTLPRGAGLGLELSRALLAHAGGTLTEQGGDGGTTWTVRLPDRGGRRGS